MNIQTSLTQREDSETCTFTLNSSLKTTSRRHFAAFEVLAKVVVKKTGLFHVDTLLIRAS
jgi:hypothetical protein